MVYFDRFARKEVWEKCRVDVTPLKLQSSDKGKENETCIEWRKKPLAWGRYSSFPFQGNVVC
jgi:hypothetical protein